MTKINLFINTLFLFIAIIFCAISQCSCALSNKRLCYDPECSEPVSLAKTVLRYTPSEAGVLAFDVNADAKVYSKEAGTRNDLWGVEINGKRGYAPKIMLKEYKVLQRQLKYEVPTNPINNNVKPSTKTVESKDPAVKSVTTSIPPMSKNKDKKKSVDEYKNLNGASPAFEVIDGTTINLSPEPPIQPTFVKQVVETTAVPNSHEAIGSPRGANNTNIENQINIFKKPNELPNGNTDSKNEQTDSKDHEVDPNTQTNILLDSSEVTTIASNVTQEEPTVPIPVSKIVKEEHASEAEKDDGDVVNQNLEKPNLTHQDHSTQEATVEETQPLEEHKSSTEATILNQIEPQSQNEKIQPDVLKDVHATESATDDKLVKETVKITSTESLEESTNSEQGNISVAEQSVPVKEEVSPDAKPVEVEQGDIPQVASIEVQPQNTLEAKPVDGNLGDSPEAKPVEAEQGDSSKVESAEVKPQNTPAAKIVEAEQGESSEVESAEVHPQNTLEATIVEGILGVIPEAKHIVGNLGGAPGIESVKVQPQNTLEGKSVENSVNNDSISSDIKANISAKNINDFDASTIATEAIQNVSSKEAPTSTESVLHTTQKVPTEIIVDSSVSNSTEDVVNEGDIHVSMQIPDTAIKTEPGSNVHVITNSEIFNNNVLTNPEAVNDAAVIANRKNELIDDSILNEVPREKRELPTSEDSLTQNYSEGSLYSSHENLISKDALGFNEFRNRNLLKAEESDQDSTEEQPVKEEADYLSGNALPDHGDDRVNTYDILEEKVLDQNAEQLEDTTAKSVFHEVQVTSPEVCMAETDCVNTDKREVPYNDEDTKTEENAVISRITLEHNYWLTLMYVSLTTSAVLVFSLGYYYIENMRRDRQLIAKINKLEKDLLLATKECTILNDNLIVTKEKLTGIEDESFGYNEMVLSLKADLEASQMAKAELEDQVAMLERDLESATEAGLELERMFREVLSSNNEVNPLAESVEDLQGRLNAQQAENESLVNALNVASQENERLSTQLASVKKKLDELGAESARCIKNLKDEIERKNNAEKMLSDKVQRLEMQLKEISTEKTALQKELKSKEVELKDLSDVVTQLNGNNLDLDKLYDVFHIKAEASALLEERNELKVRLSEVEGAHNLLEEHVKLVKEEVSSLTEQCKLAEKEKRDAETRLEVLTNFFNEKEAQRQKEEAIWLQKQGEVVSTVERLQSMQNEIQNYKQQIEMLKREILDQEQEYKGQISVLETKAHEQWVIARQVERRLEESKAEAGQLRNRLTLIEKNINEADPDTKLHRLEANGETATSPPLFIGGESSSSPIMFSGSSSMLPPPPPSYMHCSLFPPYMPPPLPSSGGVPHFEVGQRPPPLGGRLSSPPPMPLHGTASSRYENAGSPPSPLSPHMLPPYNHRSPPPPPFGSEHLHPPPPPPPGSILPPSLGSTHPWGEESLPPLRNSSFHPHQREQRVRNHKGSLHSSGESLDKSHHNSKV